MNRAGVVEGADRRAVLIAKRVVILVYGHKREQTLSVSDVVPVQRQAEEEERRASEVLPETSAPPPCLALAGLVFRRLMRELLSAGVPKLRWTEVLLVARSVSPVAASSLESAAPAADLRFSATRLFRCFARC